VAQPPALDKTRNGSVGCTAPAPPADRRAAENGSLGLRAPVDAQAENRGRCAPPVSPLRPPYATAGSKSMASPAS